jgi:hypothetical protein
MKKAIKFFQKDGDLLRPFYVADRREHPNYTSRLGTEQTFQSDSLDQTRQAFSTLGLRDKSSRGLFKQLLKHNVTGNTAPFIVGVEDEYNDEESARRLDAPSERLYRKIKPLLELMLPKELQLSPSNGGLQRAFERSLKERSEGTDDEAYNSKVAELAEQYDKAETENERSRVLDLLDKLDEEHNKLIADVKYAKGKIKSAYKLIRENGYTPMEIQQAINAWKEHPNDFWFSDNGLSSMLGMNKGFDAALDKLVTELEADPDMESDRRLKRLIPAVQGIV